MHYAAEVDEVHQEIPGALTLHLSGRAGGTELRSHPEVAIVRELDICGGRGHADDLADEACTVGSAGDYRHVHPDARRGSLPDSERPLIVRHAVRDDVGLHDRRRELIHDGGLLRRSESTR